MNIIHTNPNGWKGFVKPDNATLKNFKNDKKKLKYQCTLPKFLLQKLHKNVIYKLGDKWLVSSKLK